MLSLGPNCQYLYMLAEGMRALGVVDGELFELEILVRRAQQRNSPLAGRTITEPMSAKAAPVEEVERVEQVGCRLERR